MKDYWFEFSKKKEKRGTISFFHGGHTENLLEAVILFLKGYKVRKVKKFKAYFSNNSSLK